MPIERRQVTDEEIETLVSEFRKGLMARIRKHGRGVFVGKMEGQGAVTEEWKELVDAVQAGHIPDIRKEAMDVAIAGAWLHASLAPIEDVVCDMICSQHQVAGFNCRHRRILGNRKP